jgi:hypothetical protein
LLRKSSCMLSLEFDASWGKMRRTLSFQEGHPFQQSSAIHALASNEAHLRIWRPVFTGTISEVTVVVNRIDRYAYLGIEKFIRAYSVSAGQNIPHVKSAVYPCVGKVQCRSRSPPNTSFETRVRMNTTTQLRRTRGCVCAYDAMAAAEAGHLTSFVQPSPSVQDPFEEDCRYWSRTGRRRPSGWGESPCRLWKNHRSN